jgi:hypothetical protein
MKIEPRRACREDFASTIHQLHTCEGVQIIESNASHKKGEIMVAFGLKSAELRILSTLEICTPSQVCV